MLITACKTNGVDPITDGDGIKEREDGTIKIKFFAGGDKTQRPNYIMQDYELSRIPETSLQQRERYKTFYQAILFLEQQRSESLLRIAKRIKFKDQLKSSVLFNDLDKTLRNVTTHPDILAPLIRRYYKTQNWSDNLIKADALFTKRKGPELENSILQSKASHTLASMLKYFSALDAAVVDVHGNLIASTKRDIQANIADSPAWQFIIAKENMNKILITETTHNTEYGIQSKKIAAPISLAGEENVIGWLLATLYSKGGH